MIRKEEEVDKMKKNIGLFNKLQFGARGSEICFLIKTLSFIKMKPKKTNFYRCPKSPTQKAASHLPYAISKYRRYREDLPNH